MHTYNYIYGGFLSHVMWYPQVTMGFNTWSNDSGVPYVIVIIITWDGFLFPAESRFFWDELRFAAAWDPFAVPNKS